MDWKNLSEGMFFCRYYFDMYIHSMLFLSQYSKKIISWFLIVCLVVQQGYFFVIAQWTEAILSSLSFMFDRSSIYRDQDRVALRRDQTDRHRIRFTQPWIFVAWQWIMFDRISKVNLNHLVCRGWLWTDGSWNDTFVTGDYISFVAKTTIKSLKCVWQHYQTVSSTTQRNDIQQSSMLMPAILDKTTNIVDPDHNVVERQIFSFLEDDQKYWPLDQGKLLSKGDLAQFIKRNPKNIFKKIDLTLRDRLIEIKWKQKTSLYVRIPDNIKLIKNDTQMVADIPVIELFDSCPVNSCIEHISLGGDDHYVFVDQNNNPATTQIIVELSPFWKNQNLVVYHAQQEGKRELFDQSHRSHDKESWVIIVDTPHWSSFSIALMSGSFVINNDAEVTTGTSVTLNNTITWATLMRYGNSPAERDSAWWIAYTTSYTRNLTWDDGLKTIYAEFADGFGNTGMVSDSIFLNRYVTGSNVHVPSTFNGSSFLNTVTNIYNFDPFNWVGNTFVNGEQVMTFNGTNQYVQRTQKFITAYPFTISAWVRPDRLIGTQVIVSHGRFDVDNTYYELSVAGTQVRMTARNTTEQNLTVWPSLTVGKWYHVVWVFQTATQRHLYLNGNLIGTQTSNVWFNTNTNWNNRIWARAGLSVTNYFSWAIDEVRMYPKALTTTEITKLAKPQTYFEQLVTHTPTPKLVGATDNPNNTVLVTVDNVMYTWTVSWSWIWTVPWSAFLTPLDEWTYDVSILTINPYGYTWLIVVTGWLIVQNIPELVYSTTEFTTGNVTVTLSWLQSTSRILNNSWKNTYVFTDNNTFEFLYEDKNWSTWSLVATVSRITIPKPSTQKAWWTSNDRAFSIAIDSAGNQFIAGSFAGTANLFGFTKTSSWSDDYFLTKRNSDEQGLWTLVGWGTWADLIRRIGKDSANNIYVAGQFSFTATMFGTSAVSAWWSDVFVAKLNNNGTLQWIRYATWVWTEQVWWFYVDESGNSYVAWFYSSASPTIFGQTLTHSWSNDAFIAKLNTAGTTQRVKKFWWAWSDIALWIHALNNGTVVAVWRFEWINTDVFGTSLTSSGSSDIVVVSFTSSWTPQRVRKFGGSAEDYANAVTQKSDGTVFVGWNFANNITVWSGYYTTAGNFDMVIIKLDSAGSVLWSTRGGMAWRDEVIQMTTRQNDVVMIGQMQNAWNFFGITLTWAGNDDVFVGLFDHNLLALSAQTAWGTLQDQPRWFALGESGFVHLVGNYKSNPWLFFGSSLSNSWQDDIFAVKTKLLYITGLVLYNPDSATSGNVLAQLTWLNDDVTITNNGGSGLYLFTGNGIFTFLFQDSWGNKWFAEAVVTWIDKNPPVLSGGTLTQNLLRDSYVTYTFTSNETWSIMLSGSCDDAISFTPTIAWSWLTSLVITGLAIGEYNDCTVIVTDNVGNMSTWLTLPYFFIVSPEPVSIWSATWIVLNALSSSGFQQVQAIFTEPFFVKDPQWLNSGRYTTISATNLVWSHGSIPSSWIFFQASWVVLLSGNINPNVVIDTGILSFQSLDTPRTYIKRDSGPNSFLTWTYGDFPTLRVDIPAYQAVGVYTGSLVFTLYWL